MRELSWESEWGRGYDLNWKRESIVKVLQILDRENAIGSVVVDVGSGAYPVSACLQQPGRKIIEVDIVAVEKGKGALRLPFDIQKLDDGSVRSARTLLKAADYLGKNPRTSEKQQVDTIIYSEILNYVDGRMVLGRLDGYLKPGGRAVIFNMPNRGYHDLFSERKLSSSDELVEVFSQLGYSLEYIDTNSYSDQPFLFLFRKGIDQKFEEF